MPPHAETPADRRLLVEPAPVARRGPLSEQLRAAMPIHLFDDHDAMLTRCALLGDYVLDRITEDPAEATCLHCRQEGPAAAYVVLPDGHVVERRSSALSGHHFAVAVLRAGTGGTVYGLAGWMTDIADARTARDHQLLRGRAARIRPVRFAGTSAR